MTFSLMSLTFNLFNLKNLDNLDKTQFLQMKDRVPDFSNSLYDSTDDSTECNSSKIEMAAHRPRRDHCCPVSPFVHNFRP